MFTGGVGPHEDEVMQTFAMIKPDCIKAGHKDEILKRIKVLLLVRYKLEDVIVPCV